MITSGLDLAQPVSPWGKSAESVPRIILSAKDQRYAMSGCVLCWEDSCAWEDTENEMFFSRFKHCHFFLYQSRSRTRENINIIVEVLIRCLAKHEDMIVATPYFFTDILLFNCDRNTIVWHQIKRYYSAY